MSPTPNEGGGDGTINKLKIWAFPALLGVLNIILTSQISGYTSKIEKTNEAIGELNTTVKLETLERQYLTQRVTNLETGKTSEAAADKERDNRLNSLEQRAAMFDEFMSSHKNR